MLSLIGFLIGVLVGVNGMMIMYSIYPDVMMAELTCECPELHKIYDQPRQLFAVLGWCFSFIPVGIMFLYIRQKLNQEEKIAQHFDKKVM